jgi:hypothetical protein
MKYFAKVLLPILGVGVLFVTPASAQSCNPAVVDYIVRDEKGTPLNEAELKVIFEQLPKTIDDAQTAMTEVSFAADGQTFYWPESVDWDKGKKIHALEFANAATCTLQLGQVNLSYHGKHMSLIFNVAIARGQPDRRPVIDSLSFQEGTFRLDLAGWTPVKDQLIPAQRWKK